jgi:hypothetical protein
MRVVGDASLRAALDGFAPQIELFVSDERGPHTRIPPPLSEAEGREGEAADVR